MYYGERNKEAREHFYEFRLPESINIPAMFQLSDRYLDNQYDDAQIEITPDLARICK